MTSASPRRPALRLPIRLWNGAAGLLQRDSSAGASPLCADSLMEAAARKAGVSDFGDESFIEPLRLLVGSINTSACLHPFGGFLTRRMLIELLCNRLYVESEWKRSGEAERAPIRRPLIIVGLPRTGTTFLFNLLASDPDHRFLTNWEAHRPVPPPASWTATRTGRRMISAVGLTAQHYLAPGLSELHETRVDGPDECTGLLLNGFASQAFAAPFNVPEYVSWLDVCDYAPATRYHRRQIQLLHAQRGGQRWLLKSPNHLPALGALLETYPDACVIQTHRDPAKALPSCCSLVAAFRALFSDRLDRTEIGAQTAHILANGLRRATAARDRHDPNRFLDVHYTHLVSDPLSVVREVYRHFELPLAGQTGARLQAAVARSVRGGRFPHRYSLGQFGLDLEATRRLFDAYSSRFSVCAESP